MTVTTSDTGSERPLVLIQTNQEEVFPGSSKVELLFWTSGMSGDCGGPLTRVKLGSIPRGFDSFLGSMAE